MTSPFEPQHPQVWAADPASVNQLTPDTAGLPLLAPGQAPPHPAGTAHPADDDLFGTDEDVVGPPRANRWTVLLAAGLVAVAGFAGGVWVQKSHDAGLTSSSTASRARGAGAFAGPGGFAGAGGFGAGPAGGTGGAGSGAAASGAAAGGAQSGGAPAETGVPVVVGTIRSVAPTTISVTNFAGTTVQVRVGPATTVTSTGATAASVGAPVTVYGTKAADGSVTATTVVVRVHSAG